MMTEPVGPGTKGWQSWQDYGRLLARVMSRTAADIHGFEYQLTRQGGQIHIDAVRSIAGKEAVPSLVTQDQEQVIFTEMAPGRFRASVPLAVSRPLSLEGRDSDTPRYFYVPAAVSAEDQVDPARGLDLLRLAQVTGGANLSGGERAASATTTTDSLSLQKLWPWVLLLALLVYLGELLYRRWPTKQR